MQVLTVILNYRTPDLTLKAAAAARRAMQGIDGEIVVVDNASGDGSFRHMSTEAEARGWTADGRLRVVQSGRNGGFGAGNNFGMAAGMHGGKRPDFVYILNSDAAPAPGAIRALLDHMAAHPDTGIAGSYIHGPAGDWHCTCFRFPSIASEFEGAARIGAISRLLGATVPLPMPTAPVTPVDWLAGASAMLRQDMLDRIGGFDERFFLYFEETDLCRRARGAGWGVDYVRASKVAHVGSASTGMKTWRRVPGYWFASRQRYFVKSHGRAYAAAATLARVAGTLLWRVKRVLTGHRRVDPPFFLRDLVAHGLRSLRPRRTAAPWHRRQA